MLNNIFKKNLLIKIRGEKIISTNNSDEFFPYFQGIKLSKQNCKLNIKTQFLICCIYYINLLIQYKRWHSKN